MKIKKDKGKGQGKWQEIRERARANIQTKGKMQGKGQETRSTAILCHKEKGNKEIEGANYFQSIEILLYKVLERKIRVLTIFI